MVITGSKVSLGLLPKLKLTQEIGQRSRLNHSRESNSQGQIYKHTKSNDQNNFHNHFHRILIPIESHLPQTATINHPNHHPLHVTIGGVFPIFLKKTINLTGKAIKHKRNSEE